MYQHLTHLCRVDSSTTTLWTDLFQIAGCLISFYCYYVIEIPVFNANSVDTDQTPRSAASGLDLHCFPINISGSSN